MRIGSRVCAVSRSECAVRTQPAFQGRQAASARGSHWLLRPPFLAGPKWIIKRSARIRYCRIASTRSVKAFWRSYARGRPKPRPFASSFTKWCSPSNERGWFDDSPESLVASKCWLLPSCSRSYVDPISTDQNSCAKATESGDVVSRYAW